MNKYLITGFSGFVGYHFVSQLDKNVTGQTSVLGIDILEPSDFELWNFDNLELDFKKINLLDEKELSEIIIKYEPTHILHLAALSSVGQSWNKPAECFINNTNIFLNILEIVRLNNLKSKILCIGSSEEYGYVDECDMPIEESLHINPASPYAVTKVAQEGMAKCYVSKYDMNIMLTRSFNHIGPRQRDNFVIASFVKQVAEAFVCGKKELEMITGNIDVIRDFLDVRDVANAYYLIFEKGIAGELYNVCSSKGYALLEIIKLLSEISHINITTKIDSNLIRPNDMPKIIGDNSKIKNQTGWIPKYDIKETLSDIFDFWVNKIKEENKL